MSRLEGKTALVTGGARGIGRACVETLARAGARVIATDIDDVSGQAVAAALTDGGASVRYLHHDVADPDHWQAVLADIRNREGALHVLVNNAGIAWAGSILEMRLEDWRRQQAVNVEGVFLGIQHAVPLIRASGGGSIVNMSSVAGLEGSAMLAGYCATKGAVRLLTKGVAKEAAQAGWNIRVNSVHPGIIDTEIWRSIVPVGANDLNVQTIAATSVPGGKAGTPQDIANGVLFLASDDARYVNGAELVIDAGLSA
jgi:NAD(P)-dependent dehydrogenase (short-subunit alcohol dehydrogenase family)